MADYIDVITEEKGVAHIKPEYVTFVLNPQSHVVWLCFVLVPQIFPKN